MKRNLLIIFFTSLISTGSAKINDQSIMTSQPVCTPKITIQDWKIAPGTWGTGKPEMEKKDSLSLTKQFTADIVVFFNTMFPSNEREKSIHTCKRAIPAQQKSQACLDKKLMIEDERQNFVKRLFLILADAPLQFTEQANNIPSLKTWPYPLAVALSHGQRILFDMEIGDGNTLYNLLLTGDFSKIPQIDMTRLGASHGFSAEMLNGKLEIKEKKLGGLKNLPKNMMLGITGKHRGVNIAIGGVGNPDKFNQEIAPEGFRYDNSTKTVSPKVQHGHAYLQVSNFNKNRSALMVGIEGSMPCTTCSNMYGNKHTAKSGFVSSENLPSLMGGQKMLPLLKERQCAFPAPIGGMWVKGIDKEYLDHLNKLFQTVLQMPIGDQEKLFKEILVADGEAAKNILKSKFPNLYQPKVLAKN
ncbi:MAG: hypothetical protein FJX03_03335 [Alphaproteobacteria bacterium]|nr:hypothetical protein [Alphaproteobacteria bacterium]